MFNKNTVGLITFLFLVSWIHSYWTHRSRQLTVFCIAGLNLDFRSRKGLVPALVLPRVDGGRSIPGQDDLLRTILWRQKLAGGWAVVKLNLQGGGLRLYLPVQGIDRRHDPVRSYLLLTSPNITHVGMEPWGPDTQQLGLQLHSLFSSSNLFSELALPQSLQRACQIASPDEASPIPLFLPFCHFRVCKEM